MSQERGAKADADCHECGHSVRLHIDQEGYFIGCEYVLPDLVRGSRPMLIPAELRAYCGCRQFLDHGPHTLCQQILEEAKRIDEKKTALSKMVERFIDTDHPPLSMIEEALVLIGQKPKP